MTREERLQYCKVCKNKKFNFKEGLLCKLTGKLAEFEGECEHFDLIEGEKVQERKPRKINLLEKILKEKISIKDIFILLSFSVIITFIIRFLLYSSLCNSTIYFFLIFISYCFILIIRDKHRNKIHFYEDLKFRLIYSFLIPFFNILYYYAVYEIVYVNVIDYIYLFIIFFILSFINIIIVNLFFIIFRNKSKNNESI